MTAMENTLLATAPLGLEAVVAREVSALGHVIAGTENGRVFFTAPPEGIARANLWLRTADRVHLVAGRFRAETFDELFEKTRSLPWSEWIGRNDRFPVAGRSHRSKLASAPACQSIVKKAIARSLEATYGQTWFAETGPTVAIEVTLLEDEALLTIDTSGAGLHKRGYRSAPAGPAPVKETLAAALVLLSRWGPHRTFADPFCGSGTIAIEAAMIARDMAPGLNRTFAAESFPWVGSVLWQTAREEARDRRRTDGRLSIEASDIDPSAVALARDCAVRAGVRDDVRLTVQDARTAVYPDEYGCIVTNPPYGERIGVDAHPAGSAERRALRELYGAFGRSVRRLPTWSCFVIASDPEFERWFGRRADKRRKLYNGRIECQLYQYLGPLPPRRPTADPPGGAAISTIQR